MRVGVTFHTEPYQTSDWFPAWLTKNGRSRLVRVGLPYYTWKDSFVAYAAKRGFSVTWR